MFELLILSLNLAAALFLLYETNAPAEYAALLTKNKFGAQSYLQTSYVGRRKSFFEFLHDSRKPTYLTRLLKCPICLGVFISLFLCLIFNNLWMTGGCYIFGIVSYKIFSGFLEIFNKK